MPSAKLVGDRRYSIISDYIGTPVEAYDEGKELGRTEGVGVALILVMKIGTLVNNRYICTTIQHLDNER